jgi:Ras-related protein Rab-2A
MLTMSLVCSLGFLNARSWLAEVREHADPHVSCILVGNKVDLCEDSTPSATGTSPTSSTPPKAASSPIKSVREKNTASRTLMKGKAREVTRAEAEQWAKEEGMRFVEASAKSGLNVEQAFVEASCDIMVKIKQGVFDDHNVRLFSFLSPSRIELCRFFRHLASNFQVTVSQVEPPLQRHAVLCKLPEPTLYAVEIIIDN